VDGTSSGRSGLPLLQDTSPILWGDCRQHQALGIFTPNNQWVCATFKHWLNIFSFGFGILNDLLLASSRKNILGNPTSALLEKKHGGFCEPPKPVISGTVLTPLIG